MYIMKQLQRSDVEFLIRMSVERERQYSLYIRLLIALLVILAAFNIWSIFEVKSRWTKIEEYEKHYYEQLLELRTKYDNQVPWEAKDEWDELR